MSFEPPIDPLIRQAFPQIEDLTLLDKGGFKAVYQIRIGGKSEAFKLILIPSYAGNPDADSFRDEMIVIAAWMFINYTLTVNGFEVINGYSDILSPFLGAAGGKAGALGWWSNLRSFSLDRFAPSEGGGRLPIQRYTSLSLLNRIAFYEFDQLRRLMPSVVNKLPSDSLYDPSNGSEPQRNMEVIQSWDAVKELNSLLVGAESVKSLKNCNAAVTRARVAYDTIQGLSIRLDQKSNAEHLQPLTDGLRLFAKLAELDESIE